MSRREDSIGGRFEPETLTFSGVGMAAGRRRLLVARGPLRGLVGNVSAACAAKREKETA